MYLNDEDLKKWGDYVKGIVGEDSDKGAVLVAEKSDGIEVKMAGSKEEELELLAYSIYNFSKIHSIAFADVLNEITETWDRIQSQNLIGHFGNEVIDLNTGIGFNEEEGMVSFPMPSQEEMEKFQKIQQENYALLDAISERFSAVGDIYAFLDECTDTGICVADEKTGEKFITFAFEGIEYDYYPFFDNGYMCFRNDDRINMLPYENDQFREAIIRVIEENE